VYVNKRSIRSFSQELWRENIGVVSQKTHLFNATIRDNLLIARPGLVESEIVEVAKMLHLHDFIQTLPNGYDTWIGERGMRLSGGERQKISIARALLKDAPLLILDEATAHLDPISEQQTLSSLLSITKAKTLLMITHRIADLDKMDEILVLDQGRIVERGRHDDLLQSGGLYRKMWDIQNQLLRED
jgi:ABC-type multidrug transport system fused ATPase/permease subunit